MSAIPTLVCGATLQSDFTAYEIPDGESLLNVRLRAQENIEYFVDLVGLACIDVARQPSDNDAASAGNDQPRVNNLTLTHFTELEIQFAQCAYGTGRRQGHKPFSEIDGMRPRFLPKSLRKCIRNCDICKIQLANSMPLWIFAPEAPFSCAFGLCSTCFDFHHSGKDLSVIAR